MSDPSMCNNHVSAIQYLEKRGDKNCATGATLQIDIVISFQLFNNCLSFSRR